MRVIICLVGFAFFTSLTGCSQPISKVEAEKRITAWYETNSEGYHLDLTGDEVQANITRYHLNDPEEPNYLLVVDYQGMAITLCFKQAIKDIEKTPEAYAENFAYVVLDHIYHTIEVPGWSVNPRTPSSSTSHKDCVVFIAIGDDQIAFEVNWETFTVMGYSEKKKCQNELQIADAGVSEECMAYVRKTLPLKVTVDVKLTGK